MVEHQLLDESIANNGTSGQVSLNGQEPVQKKRTSNRLVTAFVALAVLSRLAQMRRASQGRTQRKPGYILPNTLLFTPYRKATRKMWQRMVNLDTSVTHPSLPVAEVDGSTYTFESLQHATDNFTKPAVVRGLFKGTPALEHWPTAEYLSDPERLGNFLLPVVRDAKYGSDQEDRMDMTFRDAFLEIVADHASKYLFFPVQSRFRLDATEQSVAARERLKQTVNELVRKDLQLDRIWPGFGGPSHKHYVGSQLIIGYGNSNPKETTGTGWHCALSNNFFIQVAGGKRWYFIDPQMSSYLYPVRNGTNSFMTGSNRMAEIQNHIPSSYVDLGPGDMLYNPYWQWHTVMNHAGLSIGVPIREVELRSALRNNPLYSAIAIANNLSIRLFKQDIGGYGDGTGE